MASGEEYAKPKLPTPPAFATAATSSGVLNPPAIGARKIGIVSCCILIMIARSQRSNQQTFISFLLGLEAFAALPLTAFNQTLAVEPNKGMCPVNSRLPASSIIPKPLKNSQKEMNLKKNQKITPHIIALAIMDLIKLFTCVCISSYIHLSR